MRKEVETRSQGLRPRPGDSDSVPRVSDRELKQCRKYRTLILSPLTPRREAAIFHMVGQAPKLCVLLLIQVSAGLRWVGTSSL